MFIKLTNPQVYYDGRTEIQWLNLSRIAYVTFEAGVEHRGDWVLIQLNDTLVKIDNPKCVVYFKKCWQWFLQGEKVSARERDMSPFIEDYDDSGLWDDPTGGERR